MNKFAPLDDIDWGHDLFTDEDRTLVFRCAECKDTGFREIVVTAFAVSQIKQVYCECHIGQAKQRHGKQPEGK